MIELEFSYDQIDQATETFKKIAKRMKDLSPVYKLWVPFYQKFIASKSSETFKIGNRMVTTQNSVWASRGKGMGKVWAPLSPAYDKWKKTVTNKGMLELSGKMRNIMLGEDSGLQVTMTRKILKLRLNKLGYEKYIQFGTKKMPARPFFMNERRQVPLRAMNALTDMLWGQLNKETKENLK